MMMHGLVAAVMLHVPPYGTSAAVDGGVIDMTVFRPGWEVGAPKTAYAVSSEWKQDGKAVACTYRVHFKEDIDLQCIGLQWRMNAARTAGRGWSADGQVRRIPEKFASLTLGEGVATSFSFPLPDGKALTCSFSGPTRYWAQDNRKWGEDWLLRFGPALDRRLHLRGEELVYRVRFASSEGVRLEKPDAVVIRADDSWTRFENRKDILEGSALDFSGQGLQDAPAGKYGWLKAVRGTFEFALRPGVAQRFYGVNLCFSANFPTREEADALIVRFVRSGYNAIRIHHHDDWWAKHPESREKLDYLVARAISCGLYVTTDLYVSRRATWRELGEDRPGGPSTQLYKTLVQTDERAYANWLAFAKEFRATDYYGNPRTTDGVVYCGAVQAACTNVTSGLAFRRPYDGGALLLGGRPVGCAFRMIVQRPGPCTAFDVTYDPPAGSHLLHYTVGDAIQWPKTDGSAWLTPAKGKVQTVSAATTQTAL